MPEPYLIDDVYAGYEACMAGACGDVLACHKAVVKRTEEIVNACAVETKNP